MKVLNIALLLALGLALTGCCNLRARTLPKCAPLTDTVCCPAAPVRHYATIEK